jgi:hypothetical protein
MLSRVNGPFIFTPSGHPSGERFLIEVTLNAADVPATRPTFC